MNFFSKYLQHSSKILTFAARKWRNCILHRKKIINFKMKMKLKDFIEQFSHSNEIYIENKERKQMYYSYPKDKTAEETGTIMDWELKFTDIADREVVEIFPGNEQSITIVIDTEDDTFRFIPELITIDNAPLWLYNAAHGANVRGCDACV